jgi:hypothetical protein
MDVHVHASDATDTAGPTAAQSADGAAATAGDYAACFPSLPCAVHEPFQLSYASLDCSAHVHTAHREAKLASNILSSKRDRYMLSPCAVATPQFIVVELCEDIRVNTVQLANFEFVSGVARVETRA